jgi:type 1 glutamine amidotransferase
MPGTGGGTGGAGTGGTAGSGTGGAPPAPINVLVWNTAAAFSHQSRVTAIPFLQAREATDNFKLDLRYAKTDSATSSSTDTTSDASVFTDAGLAPYDVVLFLNTSGNTLDLDGQGAVHRQALIDFMKKGRGFVGVHAAADTYVQNSWPWYVDFIGANMANHSSAGTSGIARVIQPKHAVLAAANTPDPWNRMEEWLAFTRDPLALVGFTGLLSCTDNQLTTQRPITWVHEMPAEAGAPRVGRMFYTGFGHAVSAFQEAPVMDLIVAGLKWAAYRP